MTYRELLSQLDEDQLDQIVVVSDGIINGYCAAWLEFTDENNDTLDEGHPILLIS